MYGLNAVFSTCFASPLQKCTFHCCHGSIASTESFHLTIEVHEFPSVCICLINFIVRLLNLISYENSNNAFTETLIKAFTRTVLLLPLNFIAQAPRYSTVQTFEQFENE